MLVTATRIKIDQVDCYWGSVPVQCLFSYGSVDRFPFVLVRLTAAGLTGWGESLHPIHDPFVARLRQLPGASLAGVVEQTGVEDYLDEAVDMAAHDLLSHALRKPLCDLLGTPRRRLVPLMPTIFAADPGVAARQAEAFARQQMRYLKVKLQGSLDVDLPVVRAIRASAPHVRHLVGDANQSYSLPQLQAGDALAQLKAAGLNIIEDPCAGDFAELATLRSPDHPRMMLDMPVRSRAAIEAALDADAADLVNLHPCQQGSFREAIARAALCEARGVTAWVGGTGFLGVGSAAYQHLAGVVGLSGPCGELAGCHDHGMERFVDTQVNISNGYAQLPHTPGHGATPMLGDRLAPYLEGSLRLE